MLRTRLIGFFSCLVELFTDKRSPEIGRCYELNTSSGIDAIFLRTEPFKGYVHNEPHPQGFLLSSGIWVYPESQIYYKLDATIPGTFLVIKLHGMNGPVWNSWVQVIYANEKDTQRKGWLPRWEFVQFVLPRRIYTDTTNG